MPLSTNPAVSIVVPFYRGSREISARLDELLDFIHASTRALELIIVDDGSPAPTAHTLETYAHAHEGILLVRHAVNTGKGRSIADGVAVAHAPIIIFTDGDVPYTLSAVEHAAQVLEHDARIHFVVGSRRHHASQRRTTYGLLRRFVSWVYSRITSVALHINCTDVGCGLKGFRADAARLLFSNLITARFAFDAELFIRARQYTLSFQEIPVVFQRNDPMSPRIIFSILRMGKDLLRIYARYTR